MKIKTLVTLGTLVILISIIPIIPYVFSNDTTNFSNNRESIFNESLTSSPLPKFETDSIYKGKISLIEIKNEVILLNFWASWCQSCVAEFSSMLKIVKEYNGKVALVAISINEKKKDIDIFLKKLEKTSGVKVDDPDIYWVWDKNKKISAGIFNTFKVPETIIIDKNKMMVKKVVGFLDWKDSKVQGFIGNLLKK